MEGCCVLRVCVCVCFSSACGGSSSCIFLRGDRLRNWKRNFGWARGCDLSFLWWGEGGCFILEGTELFSSWPGKSHGQRSPAGYSPGGHKESDPTEHTRRHTGHQSNGRTRFLKIRAMLVFGKTKKKALHFTGGFQIWFSFIFY